MPYQLKQKVDVIPMGYKIKAAGMFDFEELYQELQRWVVYNGYKWQEIKYRVVENPDGLKQVELKWDCPRTADDYVTFTILMHLQVFHTDVEANIDGVKRKLNKGSFEFRLGAFFEKKWDVWEKNWWGEFKKNVYERLIIRQRLEDYEIVLFKEAHLLFDEIRAYMRLYGAE